MDTDCSVKFATEIHVYIFSLLLLSFTGQMECTAVPAQDSEFTAETNEGFNPHFNALPSSQRSCNAKDQKTNSRDKKHNFLPQKQIAGPGKTKAAIW